MSRVRRFSPWVLGLLAATPLGPAAGQNLDAGKPASQIFAEVCASCHRSPREFKNNPGTGFLREHYTTGSDMAATMSAYLSAGIDPRGAGASQPKRPPAGTAAVPSGAATTREPPAADPPARDPRRAQQAAEPKASPTPPGSNRSRPASARADSAKPETSAAEAKPLAPTRPALEEFEE